MGGVGCLLDAPEDGLIQMMVKHLPSLHAQPIRVDVIDHDAVST